MGIHGLFKFIQRHEQHVYIPTCIRGKTVAIDIFTFLHQSKGNIDQFMNLLTPYIENAASIVAVFDGSPSEQRSTLLLPASSRRACIHQSIRDIQEALANPFTRLSNSDRFFLNSYIKGLEQQAWTPSPQYVWKAHDMLISKGIMCHIVEKGEEADSYLATCNADIIVSNDSDLLALNVKRLLRPNGTYYEMEALLAGLQFTEEDWLIFIRLCRTMKQVDPEFAFTVMKLYKGDTDYIYEKYEDIFQ